MSCDEYDPWADLGTRRGVDILWHTGDVDRFKKPLGVTCFSGLSITLLVGQPEHKLRSTLAHELVHLERGPFLPAQTSYQERRVSVLAAQRLLDPTVFKEVMAATDGDPSHDDVRKACRVDWQTFYSYAKWHETVTVKTVERAWARRLEPVQWPPRWVVQDPKRWELAARILGT
jgi:hypothetical protein